MSSFKDFTGRNLRNEKIEPGETIEASCFSQEKPDTHVFPDDMTGVTFLRCNLDNVFIPEGNLMIDCRQRRFLVQNDGNDWEVDENNLPVQLLNNKIFTKLGLDAPTPEELPLERVDEAIDWVAVKTAEAEE